MGLPILSCFWPIVLLIAGAFVAATVVLANAMGGDRRRQR